MKIAIFAECLEHIPEPVRAWFSYHDFEEHIVFIYGDTEIGTATGYAPTAAYKADPQMVKKQLVQKTVDEFVKKHG